MPPVLGWCWDGLLEKAVYAGGSFVPDVPLQRLVMYVLCVRR